ncbi:ABC transporter ATP-binding protein [Rhodoligotrophos defluvii]|uniref:ABC transporter ATP-binding protein n=1 Tax=Rhodoligotrophos defluvii TaxID=2561934 RepID=UPI0010C9C075|nr:ABC transporter ATP-binding protein [Rhodoligotrophos defluvii]
MRTDRPSRAGLAVSLSGISKSFGSTVVLSDCNLDVQAGSFVTLLGASGSGKTTLLRIIAGFLAPDRGEVRFDGHSVLGIPPHKRDIGMVFQSYALFPHMTVFDNVAYPLRMRGTKAGLRARVSDVLDMVQLSQFAERMPAGLSGGQRQRVAMARALVAKPPLVLLDEPLSALDKELREQLQVEIKSIHRQAGTTFVNVTHDQGEAMGMSDMVAVMDKGRIQQADRPEDLWNKPANAFVARFLGGSNLIRAKANGGNYLLPDGKALRAGAGAQSGLVELAFRPETVRLAAEALPDGDSVNCLDGRVVETIFLGEAVRVVVDAAGQAVSARIPAGEAASLAPGSTVLVHWPVQATTALAAEEV